MVFVPFTVIDNHRSCVTVGAGLLKNETIKSYIWLLKEFIKAFMKAPSIFVIDQDGAIRNAIETEFAGWRKLMEEFKLENHKWLRKIFNIRSTWIPAYFIDSPLCGLMRTTSRRRCSLFELVQKEIFVGLWHCQIDSKSLVEGSKVCIIKESPYVYEMPKKKKKPQSMDKVKDKAEENDTVDLFFKKDGLYKVLRNVGDGSVVCSCQLFVRVDILYKHIFCVFKNANVEMIPQQYILRCWMKNLIPAALRNKRNIHGEKNVVVENFANETTSINKTDNLEQLVGVPKPPAVKVNNPTVGLNKGQKKLCIKGEKEKAIEKSLKGRNSCSLCGGTDHNKRTCPGRCEVQDEVVVQKEVCQEEVVQEKVDLAEDEEELVEEDKDLIHE
ncbi:protein FAR1-related sequence 5 [Tanacetum coccineum]